MDDSELLRRYVQEGSQASFTELVRRHLSLVYGAALRRTGDPSMAEDAAQYVFIVLARRANSLLNHSSLAGWLYTTTRFAANRAVREACRRRRREQEAHAMESTRSASSPEWERVRPLLDAALDQLSEADRAAVLLRYFEGRSFADVGRALRLSEEAARKRVERSVERIRLVLERRGVASTGAALGVMLSTEAAIAAPAGLLPAVSATALAGATLAPTLSSSLLQIMTATKFAIAMASVLCAGALATAGYEYLHDRQIRRAIAAATAEINAESSALRRQVTAAENAEAAVARQSRRPAPGVRTWDRTAEGRRFLAAHPGAAQLVEQFEQAYVRAHYGPFLVSAGLSPTQVLAVEQKLLSVPMTLVVQTPRGPIELPLNHPSGAPAEGSPIQSALGETLFNEYQNYERLFAARAITNAVASRVALSTPLTAAQAGQLTQIIADADSQYQEGGDADAAQTDWNAAMRRAKQVLQPEQLDSLRTSIDDETLWEEEKAAINAAR